MDHRETTTTTPTADPTRDAASRRPRLRKLVGDSAAPDPRERLFNDPMADDLLTTKDLRTRTLSLRVVPGYETPEHRVRTQPDGPDAQTSFWAICTMGEDGLSRPLRGTDVREGASSREANLESARRIATAYAGCVSKLSGIEVEPQRWVATPDPDRSIAAALNEASADFGTPEEKARRTVYLESEAQRHARGLRSR